MDILTRRDGESNDDLAYRLLRTKFRSGTKFSVYLEEVKKACKVDTRGAMVLAGRAYARFYGGK